MRIEKDLEKELDSTLKNFKPKLRIKNLLQKNLSLHLL